MMSAMSCRQMIVSTIPNAAASGTPIKAPAWDDVANGPTHSIKPNTTGTVRIHLKISRAGSSLRLRQRTRHQPMAPRASASSTVPRTISKVRCVIIPIGQASEPNRTQQLATCATQRPVERPGRPIVLLFVIVIEGRRRLD